jgi:hypothetical protein
MRMLLVEDDRSIGDFLLQGLQHERRRGPRRHAAGPARR